MKSQDKKIKILHVTQSYGGVQTYILNIILNSDKQKYEFAILCPESELSRICTERGIKVYCVNIKRSPHFLDIISLMRIIAVVIKYNPDILHVHSAKAGVLGRIASFVTRKKVIFTPNAFSYLGFTGFKRLLFRNIERSLRYLTDVLLAVSDSEKARAINELNYRTENIKVIFNAIDCESYNKIRDYRIINTVGMMGRLIHQKNPEMFINIALKMHAEYPQLKFLLLGEGYQDFLREDIFSIIAKHKSEDFIKILKWGHYNIENFYNEVDVFLLTSRFEGLSFALLEAMGNGIPSIATNVDGNKDVIESGVNGFLVEENDLNDVVEKLSLLIRNQNLREEIGVAARKRINELFNIKTNIKNIDNLYYYICSNKIH
jgi:glycosyltransferase involved in cell wall biosynthesis